MILDTSPLAAILFAEPEAERMIRALAADERRIVGGHAGEKGWRR
jgi:uncharacterized protein with PIN domain